jgi:hypothetical protein
MGAACGLQGLISVIALVFPGNRLQCPQAGGHVQTNTLIRPLFDGPIDIIGDVHGELGALRHLLQRLGYDEHGEHPEGRRLVFVGDLCDRGPDSPGVVLLVRDMVEWGSAQCVAGNHEINVLRGEARHGNHWIVPDHDLEHTASFGPARHATAKQALEIRAFFASLPVALERPDLRVVHACWSPADVAACRIATGPLMAAYQAFDVKGIGSAKGRGLHDAHRAEHAANHDLLRDRVHEPPFLHAVAEYDEYYQNSNPIRVMTSGIEYAARVPFLAGGKWRFVERVPWWKNYDETPVVFGHYWRWWDPAAHAHYSKGEPDLFVDEPPVGWHRNHAGREVAICIDYSVGARYKERKQGRAAAFHARLAALRWPERDVVFDFDAE